MPDFYNLAVRLTSDEYADLESIAAAYRGNKTEAVRQAIAHLGRARQPGLAGEVWEHLSTEAKRRLRRTLSEAELRACLDITNTWLVTGADAHLIHVEIEDAGEELLVGDSVETGPVSTVDAKALAAKLAGMPDFDRAVLTVACKTWWESARPRPPMAMILGGQLRGPGMN